LVLRPQFFKTSRPSKAKTKTKISKNGLKTVLKTTSLIQSKSEDRMTLKQTNIIIFAGLHKSMQQLAEAHLRDTAPRHYSYLRSFLVGQNIITALRSDTSLFFFLKRCIRFSKLYDNLP